MPPGHDPVKAVCEHVPLAEHESEVQGLPSSQFLLAGERKLPRTGLFLLAGERKLPRIGLAQLGLPLTAG